MRKKKIKNLIDKRKVVVDMQFIQTVQKSLKGEIYMLRYISKFTDIQSNEFTFGGDKRAEIRTYFDKVCSYNDIFPLYNDNVNQQKSGGDYCYKGIFIDLKTNKEDKERACFELYKNSDGLYHFKQSKDNLIIACYMKKYNEVILVASGLIEMLANRDVKQLPIPSNFYCSNMFGTSENYSNKEVTNVYIRYDILKKLVRYYNAYYCTNDTVKYFLGNGFTLPVSASEYNEYMRNTEI